MVKKCTRETGLFAPLFGAKFRGAILESVDLNLHFRDFSKVFWLKMEKKCFHASSEW